jgi:hypothetical protein
MRRNTRIVIAALAASLALVVSCGNRDEDGWPAMPAPCDRIGHADFTGSGHGAIGPGGGVVEVTDPSSPVAGVRVEVAPGAWNECLEVRIDYATIFETPNYPAGYVPFERPRVSGAIEISVGLSTQTRFERVHQPLPIAISFPLQKIHPETLDIRSAYFYDAQAETWRIVLPRALTRQRLTIETSTHDALWSWGRVDLGEVDFERHVRPALERYHGTETVAAIEAALDEIRRQAVEQRWALTCGGLLAARGFFTACRDAAAVRIDALQANLGCGACNPLSEQFQEELEAWWQVKKWSVMLDLSSIVTMRSGKDVASVALTALLKDQEEWVQCLFDPIGCALDQLAPDTACDYECYFSKVPSLPMNVNKGVYHACDWIRGVIERYRTQTMSPPCPG